MDVWMWILGVLSVVCFAIAATAPELSHEEEFGVTQWPTEPGDAEEQTLMSKEIAS